MKRFLKKLLVFSVIVISLFSLILIILHNNSYSTDLLILDKTKNILIAGDSQTECAIDDKLFNNAINISQSADSYLYTYSKLKKIIGINPSIDTIILSYSYNDIVIEFNKYYTENKYLEYKVPKYFTLLNTKELLELFKLNPKCVLSSVPLIIKHNLNYKLNANLNFKSLDFGSYRKIENDQQKLFKLIKLKDFRFSDMQMKYLIMIYELCNLNKVKLILISTPIQYGKKIFPTQFTNKYKNFKDKKLGNASLFDFTNLKLDKSLFADLVHLNTRGANQFSIFLRDSVLVKK